MNLKFRRKPTSPSFLRLVETHVKTCKRRTELDGPVVETKERFIFGIHSRRVKFQLNFVPDITAVVYTIFE